MSKGSKPRPMSVTKSEFDDSFDRIFGNLKKVEQSLNADNMEDEHKKILGLADKGPVTNPSIEEMAINQHTNRTAIKSDDGKVIGYSYKTGSGNIFTDKYGRIVSEAYGIIPCTKSPG